MLVPPGRDAADRVHRARLPHRFGVEGVPRDGHRCTARRSPPGCCESIAAARAGVHAVDQGRGRRSRREHLASSRRSTSSARSWPSRPRDVSLELYARGAAWARRAGHHHRRHQVRARPDRRRAGLADEVLTPDSSRFWPADEWEPGTTPPSFDKQPVRDYLDGLDWDKTAAAAAAAGRGRRGHPRPLHRGLRAHHRPVASPTGRSEFELPAGPARRSGCHVELLRLAPAQRHRRLPPLRRELRGLAVERVLVHVRDLVVGGRQDREHGPPQVAALAPELVDHPAVDLRSSGRSTSKVRSQRAAHSASRSTSDPGSGARPGRPGHPCRCRDA